MSAEKRRSSVDSKEESEDTDGWIGPMPSEASKPKPKKRKGKLFYIIYCKHYCDFFRSLPKITKWFSSE